MGFKKTTKKKVKKAPGKKGRKDGWDFDGGTFTEDASKNETSLTDGSKSAEKRGPRKTQERDEYIRRGRAKIEDRKKKWQMEKKMSKKISFNDVLTGDEEAAEDIMYNENEVVEKKLYKKSSKSVMERLQNYVNSDLARTLVKKEAASSLKAGGRCDNDIHDKIKEGQDEMEMEDDDDIRNEQDGSGEDDDEMDFDEFEDSDVEKNADNENNEIGDGEISSDGEETTQSDSDDERKGNCLHEGSNNDHDDFDWLFNPKQKTSSIMKKDNQSIIYDDSSRNKLQIVSSFDNYQLYGALHPIMSSRQRTPIRKYVLFIEYPSFIFKRNFTMTWLYCRPFFHEKIGRGNNSILLGGMFSSKYFWNT